jgi:hypothetical protein
MSTPVASDAIETIDPAMLARVSGGGSSNDQITAVLTQITSSISDLAKNNNNGGIDPTMMMMMMMMMGGGGGSSAPPPAAPPPPAPAQPIINISNRTRC